MDEENKKPVDEVEESVAGEGAPTEEVGEETELKTPEEDVAA